MVVGFAGSPTRLTKEQKDLVKKLLTSLVPTEAHHGGCIGSDKGFHEICLKMGIKLVVHPGTDGYGKMPPFASLAGNYTRMKPLDHRLRNKKIVDRSDVIITTSSKACSVVKYAKKLNKRLYVLHPNGDWVHHEE
jgi:hypothetical protein